MFKNKFNIFFHSVICTITLSISILFLFYSTSLRMAYADGCKVTWIAVCAEAEPSTFWTWKTDHWFWQGDYTAQNDTLHVEDLKERMKKKVLDHISQYRRDDVSYKMTNMVYIITTVRESQCEKAFLDSKLDKISEYIKVALDSRKELNYMFISDVQNFIAEYH